MLDVVCNNLRKLPKLKNLEKLESLDARSNLIEVCVATARHAPPLTPHHSPPSPLVYPAVLA